MKRKKRLRRGAIALFSLAFLVSLINVVWRVIDDRRGTEDYAEAASLVELPPPDIAIPADISTPENEQRPPENGTASGYGGAWVNPYAEALGNMDFTALREVNPDVLGWLVIPDTVISYPLLHGEDDAYYLNHTWKGDRNACGSIFLESRCSGQFNDFNTIIYGHRMRGGSMFGTLKSFASASHWENHPNIYIATDSGEYTYAIFAAYEAALDSDTYRINISNEKERQQAITSALEQSRIETGIVPTPKDHILTLSTCTGNGHATRWVVQAVRLPMAADTPEEPAELPELPEELPELPELPEEAEKSPEPAEENEAGAEQPVV